jgi:DNA/RNA endonuclease G (NUC1)
MSNDTSGDGKFYFNGVNGATGKYLDEPKSPHELAEFALKDPTFPASIRGQDRAARHQQELHLRETLGRVEHYGPRYGEDPEKLAEIGWAVVFPQGIDPKIEQALQPLLKLRKEQAGKYYKEFKGDKGYRGQETKDEYLSRLGMGPGQPDRNTVPYYVLLVADPESIPYSFQYQLDVLYAVGRLWFDTVDEFARYAESVVFAETKKFALPRKAVLFGAENPNDRATQLSARQLVAPLAKLAQERPGNNWQVDSVLAKDATHARLGELLGGDQTPALLFTATHGMGFPANDPRQAAYQGALLCQDWPGPNGRLDRSHYFAAEDVPDSAQLAGLISFHFACYGAGTPKLDDFAHQSFRPPTAIAPQAFVAALPRRLLGHPGGGALAVVGHVERAWGCSITWKDAGPQIQAFDAVMHALMDGVPVGFALESINQRYADLSSSLCAELLRIRDTRMTPDEYLLAMQWTANNDARSYVIFGDPAARLALAEPGKPGSDRGALSTLLTRTEPKKTSKKQSPKPQSNSNFEPDATADENTLSQTPAKASAPVAEAGTASVTLHVPLKITVSVTVDTAAMQGSPAVTVVKSDVDSAGTSFAVQIDPNYNNREGYDPDFLGTGNRRVPLPKLSESQQADAAELSEDAGGGHELKYHHYSVVLNGTRQLAYFTAVNIHGKQADNPKRETDKWSYDPRVPREQQAGEDLYLDNDLDRGHLVRRLDPAWGRTPAAIKRANDDTFHFTNCSPQHKNFNQGKNLWAGLEDYLLDKASDEERRMTVFTGPIFTNSDPKYRDVKVPKKYWKVAVIARPNGRLATLGFIVDQTKLLRKMISFGPADVAKTFQVPVSRIEELTELDFGRLVQLDVGSVDSFAPNAPVERELNDYADIAFPGAAFPGGGQPASEAAPAFAPTSGDLQPPPETIAGSDLRYYMVSFDESGRERLDHPAGKISSLVQQAVADASTTDVFIMSHGWQGDVPAARAQYSSWISAMAACTADRERIRQARPGFKPVFVGIHWPSLPFGDENLGSASFSVGNVGVVNSADESSLAAAMETYAARLGDTPEVRERVRPALRSVLEQISRSTDRAPQQLSPELRAAYLQLDSAIGMGAQGVTGGPGADREPFDPAGIYQDYQPLAANNPVNFGIGDFLSSDRLLAPLRALSFWRMKDRARVIGEGAAHQLLRGLQEATNGRPVRFHLVGHSFGCIVVSGAVAGTAGGGSLQPVDSLVLLQGAVSLWAYTGNIPYLAGTPGYYHRLLTGRLVRGPVVTTRSTFDRAVGTWYPLAARTSRAVAFDAPGVFPKYGGIGSFGLQGSDLTISELAILRSDQTYSLAPGAVTNVEASSAIRNGGGFSGAHSDIANPEVAHLIWAAING